jgi:hypothetical protein
MLVGFLLEGWDYLIVQAYLAKILAVAEEHIESDPVGDAAGCGWDFVAESLETALRRFYHKCAQLAVVGADNDGNRDLHAEQLDEDPLHRRHWLHPQQSDESNCRYCGLAAAIAVVRPGLHWLPRKPGHSWPIVLAIPVETIEAWLLVTRAIVHLGDGTAILSEGAPRRALKTRFYGRPAATRRDVEGMALPMIRSMTADHVQALKQHALSFREFCDQVDGYRASILGGSCW